MDTSSTTTPDKHGSETSQSLDSSHQKTDSGNPVQVTCQRERRRREHNDMEKKRKEQIKACICKMGELLPPNYITSERHSTLEIVEKSLAYMREMKEAKTKFTGTEESLQQEVAILKAERDKFSEIIKAAGLSTESIPTNGVSSTTDVKDESPKPKNKTKKRNTLNAHLQQLQEQREKQQQQEMISSSVSVSDDTAGNLPQNQLMNMPGGAFINGQNVMFNPMMNQFMMPGMMGNGNQMMPNLGPMGVIGAGSSTGMPGVANNNIANPIGQNSNPQSDQNTGNMNKSADDSDAGLLQLAMQDAGITPGSNSGQQSSSALTPSVSETAQEAESSSSQNNALQTLASVATSDHIFSTENSSTDNQSTTASGTGSLTGSASNMPMMTSTQSGLQPMLQTSNSALINMPMLGNPTGLPGQQQQQQQQQQMQQIMFINDQGIPMIANVPVGMDPNNPNMFNNSQKPGIMPGMNQTNLIKDQTGNMDQNALALAQQQANMAALQNQLLGQNAGNNLPNMPFQPQNLLQGNIIQTPNGQLLQQIGPQINGQGQLLGMPGQGQGLVVAGQQGQLTLNTMPSQPNQLPSALILPNGQIIPVVTNPGNVVSQPGITLSQAQLTQPRMSGPQMQPAMDGQIISGPNSQGLLIPAASVGQVGTSSTAATLSTSVVPTSAIQTVMTSQIQGSTVQTQKPISSSLPGPLPNVSNSNQPKIVSIPPGAPNVGSGGIAANGKPSGTPILLSLPINGQPTTVLLDPVTMQVLGTVQPGQQPVPQQPSAAVSGVPTTAAVQPPVSAQPGATANKNKNKNNANQRAICPKPLGGEGFNRQSTPVKKKRPPPKTANKTKETAQADSLSESLQIQIPESTTDPEVSSAVSSESTDILAKAAESIFSPPAGEVAGVGGAFYNPANEDNPLHIDTSATEVEDDLKSPSKQSKKLTNVSVANTGTLEDNVLGLNSVAEGAKAINVSKVVNNAGKSEESNADNVTSLSVTLEEIAGMQFSESVTNISDKNSEIMVVSETNKVSKKSKPSSSKSSENKKETETKSGHRSGGSKNKSSKKLVAEKSSVLELEKVDSDSQMDIESTLIHIPDNITFSENDLSDVLDQVEQLGSSVSESANKGQASAKKSKSKRSKAADPESEPSSKKRKSSKDVKDSSKSNTPAKEILSMPSSLSVYDFDDSDDIVPSILPLNGKDFTALSSTPTKTELGVTDSEDSQKSETKSKNSAQTKTKKSSKSAKSSKDNEVSSQKVVSDDQSNSLLFEMKDLTDSDKKTYENKENKSDTNNQTKVSAALPSMPEIDTTTSLFGFPVPKKLQRPDMSSRAQPTPKIVSQVSPKPSSQPNTPLVSPKQPMTSPKTVPGMVSPLQNSFSPELVSPKLSIVSPIQGILPENDNVTSSPKHYTEMSPIKKRTPPEKLESMKVSSFSALNSVPLSDASTDSFTPMDSSKPAVSSQPMGVITSAKTLPPSVPESNKQSNEPKVPNEPNTVLKKNVSENVQSLPSSTQSSNVGQKPPNSGRNSSTNVENKFNVTSVPASNANSMPVSAQRPSQTSVNSSQNNRFGNQFNSDPVYGSLSGMNNRSVPKDTTARSNGGMNNFSVPYSADSIFSSHAEKVIKSPPNVNISTLNVKPDTSNLSKLRNTGNPYSVDSFVQSSREEGIRPRPDTIGAHSDLISNNDLANTTNDFSRLQSESSPDGFNFANIGLNLQPITSNIPASFMDTSSTTTSNMSSSFSFSLSSTSSTVTTSAGGIGHHQFPFFPPVLSSSSNVPSSQTSLPATMSNMEMFDQNNSGNNVIQRNNTVMHQSGNNLPRGDNSHISRVDSSNVPRGEPLQRNDKGPPPIRSDDSNREQGTNPSCSKQKMPKGQGPAIIQEPFSSFPNTSGGPDNNFFHDSQMKSNVGKSPTEQMRKPPPQDKMMEMNSSHSRSSSTQSSMSDKRGNTMDRSPQMMNNSQPYYQSNYPSSKSLNTPPLHHMMPPDERGRTMTNRSPYDTPFPPPPSSQGFNAMGPSYRFDSGPPSFSRDNSGTQPLSHTPVNSGGRKSANPPPPAQTSVVKPPQKQSAPPLVPMGGPPQAPPSQAPRPTPQSHRATTPHGNQAGPTPTPTGVSQSRQSKQPSRNSKPPSSKKSKTLPFMEVDSNLSNSIFETNRSMTPFFPTMQNLSPQSRMQHEGSPFLPGNFFGPGPRFPNSNTPMPKNSDIGAPFNPLFPPRGAQNGLGLNFQPGFGMNMNPLHGNHGNAPQLTPHTAPHMANFNLNNIFSDGASQNESSLNISPIKFPHTNTMLQHQGMEHNAMQHHHQYNRGHPSVMSINSILGPNHHGFDGRMNTSMAGPFHSHGHPSFIPPLNFSMHDH
ncbi:serine-rich adhesin for platelets-like [Mercenaria mercenaria]|uniref:serine-rich adhesin for platelets-like n=1 Tax=Mercenaria mercenaria TaxID=6596 RepID=UPI001E1DA7C4|nr:serine-rich adhesin for platelets-like [Mercenaria mercenaria]